MLKKLPGLIFLFISLLSFGQTRVIDSLQGVLTTQKSDTAKVITFNNIGLELFKNGKYDSAISEYKEGMALAEKLNYKNGVAEATNDIGSVFERQGNYTEGLSYFTRALSINKENNNKEGIANNLCGIGDLYDDQGDYQIALDYYRRSLLIDSILADKHLISITLGDIGNVYDEMGDYPMALQYDLQALKYGEELGNKHAIIVNLGNIGNIYFTQGNYAGALENYQKVLDMAQQSGDKADVAVNLGNIGLVYFSLGNYAKAIESDTRALQLDSAIGSKHGIAFNLGDLGDIYLKQANFIKAIECDTKAITIERQMNDRYTLGEGYFALGNVFIKQKNAWMARIYLDSALILSKKIGAKENIKYTYGYLMTLDSMVGDFKSALIDYKGYVAYRDSLVNDVNTKKSVQAEMNYEFDKKQTLEKLEQDKKDAVQLDEHNKQQAKIYLMGGILGLVLLFTIFILLSLRANRKKTIIISKQKEEVEKQKAVVEQQKAVVEQQKTLVEQQKNIVEQQKAKVEEQNGLIEHQKAIVEEKNKDITDSIKYASRIQRALLTTDEYIAQQVPEYFILFKPRDIVSGDFYWAFNGYGVFYIACCDCTGHGVPGAFMSLLNISMLNETIIERKIIRPDRILNDMRDSIIKSLNPEKSDKESQDGMDCSICAIDFKNMAMQAACANNPVWVLKGAEGSRSIVEIQPDKMPVGIQHGEQKPFTIQNVKLAKGDCIYMFTDGYADQFGGPKGKKFKYKALQELVLSISHKPMVEQKQILDTTIEQWRGDLEQVDDILMIGIRV